VEIGQTIENGEMNLLPAGLLLLRASTALRHLACRLQAVQSAGLPDAGDMAALQQLDLATQEASDLATTLDELGKAVPETLQLDASGLKRRLHLAALWRYFVNGTERPLDAFGAGEVELF
jgi:hypothetical protein